MTSRLVLLPSTPSVAPLASANLQVDNELQARTLASSRCEGSFAFLQRVERRLLGLARKMAQNSAVLAGLAGESYSF